jgi:protein-S-isoprenylcysteine O-methyltransferase Ste14
MNKFFISASGLDARGVGPRIMLITAPFLAAAVYCEIRKTTFAEIVTDPGITVEAIGWIWLIAGISLFIAALAQFIINFPKGNLITNGVYAFSRNPIYASWVVFILPATGLICNNWIFFAAALVMGLTTSFLVRKEEVQLLKCFGQKYYDYKSKVGLIFSFPLKNKTHFKLN